MVVWCPISNSSDMYKKPRGKIKVICSCFQRDLHLHLHLAPNKHFKKYCQQLRPVLMVLELASMTLRKLKDDNRAREIQNILQIISILPSPGGGKGDFPRWRECLNTVTNVWRIS